ncbi:MAG: 30S ribosomal protein S3ae [Candidatus Hadarchaeum sp.]|uniref:30S ribosomal protein S3ae n=1 Tax=Candidatus Hadarchaeum sp. TaxID=2883567 RepID=UPI003D104386
MAEEKKRIIKKTWREKEWFEVVAPPMFGSQKIGETLASEPEQLIGRVFETTLGDLIEDFSKSHIKLYFQVKEVRDRQALTKFIGHEMARDYIRSQVRRRAGKVDDIATVTTKDGYKLRVTSMVTTLRRVQSTKLDLIHKDMRKVVETRAAERTLDQFVQEAVLGKLSADIYKEAKKYCPIRRVEVYKSKVLSEPVPEQVKSP